MFKTNGAEKVIFLIMIMGTLGICPFGNFRGYTDFSQMGPGKCSEGISDSQALLHGQLGIVSMGHDIELKWIGPCPSL